MTINIDFVADPDFGFLAFQEDFGPAGHFTKFDDATGELLFEPELGQAGSYLLKLQMTGENNDYT